MKLSTRDANAYFAKPDPDKTGLLMYGSDAMRVALKRQEVLAALLGPAAEEEMRLTRINAGELRKDPANTRHAWDRLRDKFTCAGVPCAWLWRSSSVCRSQWDWSRDPSPRQAWTRALLVLDPRDGTKP